MMSAVGSKDTALEKVVRSALFKAGYRYRLHRRDLPGSPDIVLPRYSVAVFVQDASGTGTIVGEVVDRHRT